MLPRYQVRIGSSMKRHCASLEGGVDGFVSRRSRKFRANLRRAQRRADGVGLTFENADGARPAEVYERMLRIEVESWKGLNGVGIDTGRMRSFYARMVQRLSAAGAMRVTFAQVEGQDAAYILGGVFGETFRGLQFSYLERHRDLSLGNLLQLAMIERLFEQGISNYDLGSDIDYKKKWGESGLKTQTMVIFR